MYYVLLPCLFLCIFLFCVVRILLFTCSEVYCNSLLDQNVAVIRMNTPFIPEHLKNLRQSQRRFINDQAVYESVTNEKSFDKSTVKINSEKLN